MPETCPRTTADWLADLAKTAISGAAINCADALRLLDLPSKCSEALLNAADRLRRECIGSRVTTCSIINAKSGRCSEDCVFCAQSGRHATALTNYPLMASDEMLERAAREERHSLRCGIVTAGRGMNPAEIETVCAAIEGFQKRGLKQLPCASLGILDSAGFARLKAAGLKRFHHNLEASRAYFPRICTTHTYDERVETIRNAKAAGLEVCVGAIFGLGESNGDRVDVLEEIRQLDPAAVPLNFLVPIEGTRLAGRERMPRWEAIKIIALARLLMPRKDILIGGGRLEVFGDEQRLIFRAGANAMIVGDLLTVKGRSPDADMILLKELGLELSL
jgi:biotin synthase